MDKRSISEVLAHNLVTAMAVAQLSQSALARISGVPQRTISLYLHPADRLSNATKVPPSATLQRVAQLAAALRIEPWLLLHPQPELAMRAQAVVAAAISERPSAPVYTVHEPESRYAEKKRASAKKKPRKVAANERAYRLS